MPRINDWLGVIVAAVWGAYLVWVAIGLIAESGLAYVIGGTTACFVFAIGARWIYTRVRARLRGEAPRPVWSPWLVPIGMVVFWIARN